MKSAITAATVILALGLGVAAYLYLGPQPVCQVCHRPLHQETLYRIFLEDSDPVNACCTRCGLHFQQGRHDVVRSQVAEYSTGHLFPSSEAFFVEGSSVQLCLKDRKFQEDRSGGQYSLHWDRCLPSLVAFRTRREALDFARREGGEVKTYPELLAEEATP